MVDDGARNRSVEVVQVAQSKRHYQTPVLVTYGLVRHMTRGTSAPNTDGTSGMNMSQASDRRVKDNQIRIASHPLGIGLYLFDYKPDFRERFGTGRQFGVMADEVDQVMPQAVSVHADGYKRVNYAMLGIVRPLQ